MTNKQEGKDWTGEIAVLAKWDKALTHSQRKLEFAKIERFYFNKNRGFYIFFLKIIIAIETFINKFKKYDK
jgi:hypothetical protein